MLVERIRPIATPLQGWTHFACQFFIFVWAARIFDRHPNSIMEAEKLRARSNSVKSRVAPRRCELISRFATASTLVSRTNQPAGIFLLGHVCFCFQSRNFFVRDEK
jgi:hypothetical protein